MKNFLKVLGVALVLYLLWSLLVFIWGTIFAKKTVETVTETVVDSQQKYTNSIVDTQQQLTNSMVDSQQQITDSIVDSQQKYTNSIVDSQQQITNYFNH